MRSWVDATPASSRCYPYSRAQTLREATGKRQQNHPEHDAEQAGEQECRNPVIESLITGVVNQHGEAEQPSASQNKQPAEQADEGAHRRMVP